MTRVITARAVHVPQVQSMPDATARAPAVGAAANTSTPMTNLRKHLEQLALGRSAAAPAREGALLLLSPAPTCALDLIPFLRLGAARLMQQPWQLQKRMEPPSSPMMHFGLQSSVWTCPQCSVALWNSMSTASCAQLDVHAQLLLMSGRHGTARLCRRVACSLLAENCHRYPQYVSPNQRATISVEGWPDVSASVLMTLQDSACLPPDVLGQPSECCVAGRDVDLAALDMTAALAAEAAGGAAARQRDARSRVCWVNTGADSGAPSMMCRCSILPGCPSGPATCKVAWCLATPAEVSSNSLSWYLYCGMCPVFGRQ